VAFLALPTADEAHKKFPSYTHASAVTVLLSRAYAKTMILRNAGKWRRSDPNG
jgi:hypothetical protein